MARKKARDKQNNGKWFLCLILLMLVTIYGIIFTEKIVKPNMAAIAEVKVKAMITQVVNDAIYDQFVANTSVSDLLTIKTDNEGNISLLQSNTMAMNNLATGLTQTVQGSYKTMKPMEVMVPIGSILGSPILSQLGPYIKLKVVPIGMSRVNFVTEFESTGINQTKYKVYLELDSQARVLAPFSINNINVQNTILVAEAVIVGEVPNSYINVPTKEDALNSTNAWK